MHGEANCVTEPEPVVEAEEVIAAAQEEIAAHYAKPEASTEETKPAVTANKKPEPQTTYEHESEQPVRKKGGLGESMKKFGRFLGNIFSEEDDD